MNSLRQLIQKLQLLLSSNDLTDTAERQVLAQEYVHYCNEYNTYAEKCGELLARKMLVEAVSLANSLSPTLEEQEHLLHFAERDELLELFAMYGWPEPPLPELDVLRAMKNTAYEQKDLAPLLSAYRKIARSDDLDTKISILRKIIVLDKNSPEWRSTLSRLEEQQFSRLADEAKDAILQQDYFSLETVFQKLTDPGWLNPPRENVVGKVRKVLDDHHFEEVEKKAALYLDEINEAYSGFDYPALEKALSKWNRLLRTEQYNPDEAAAMQVREAEEYYRIQKKQKDEDVQYESLIGALRKALEKESPLPELEQTVNQIRLLEREIPENLNAHYQEYKESIEDIQRRHRLVIISASAAGAAVLLVSIGILIYSVIMNSVETEWAKRIEQALAKDTAAVSIRLLEELKKSAPSLQKRPQIMALTEQVVRKKEEEEKKREDFNALLKKIRSNLNDFARNQDVLNQDKVRLLKLVVDQTEVSAYQALEREFRTRQALYSEQQSRQYIQYARDIREERKKFFLALEKEDLKAANAALSKSESLYGKARRLPGIPVSARNEYRSYFDDIPELKNQYESEKMHDERRKTLLADIYAPISLEGLESNLKTYLAEFPQSRDSRKIRLLLQNVGNARSLLQMERKGSRNPAFLHDLQEFERYDKTVKKLYSEVRSKLEKMEKDYSNNPTYSLLIKAPDGTIYDFYFSSVSPQWSKSGSQYETKFQILATEDGKLLPAELSYDSRNNNAKMRINRKRTFSGKLIYPQTLKYKDTLLNLAPHIQLIKSFSKTIGQSSEREIETLLAGMIETALKQETVNPYLRFSMVKILLDFLRSAAPADKNYQELANALDEIKIPQNYNWLQAFETHTEFQRTFQYVLTSEIAKKTLRPSIRFRLELYETALNRKLKPLGFMKKGASGLDLTAFPNLPENGELWQITNGTPAVRILGTSFYSTLNFQKNAPKQLHEMDLLFSPTDGRKTRQLENEIRAKARELHIEQFDLPQSWPVNWRNDE